MIHLLAQTTQGSGFASWDVAQWTAFFGALTLVLGTLTTSILAIINAARAKATAGVAQTQAQTAQTTAETAHVTAAAANAKSDVNTERVSNIGNQVAAIGLATTPQRTNGGEQPRIQT